MVYFYSWRSSEPDYATKPDRYNPHFKINVADIPTFPEVLRRWQGQIDLLRTTEPK
jgi:hypothetical protein